MRIAVIGGTFNPPTNAHIKLARTAYKVLMADLVLLVPARQDYMRQWKNYQSSDILSDALRMDMLHAIEADWLKIETCEMDGVVSGSSLTHLISYGKNTRQMIFSLLLEVISLKRFQDGPIHMNC